jgi:hypothetical protein
MSVVDGHAKALIADQIRHWQIVNFSWYESIGRKSDGQGVRIITTNTPAVESLSPLPIVGDLKAALKLQSLPGDQGKVEILPNLPNKVRSLFALRFHHKILF